MNAEAARQDLDKSKIFAELNLDKNKKYILVMTGSMGFGNVTGIIDVLQNEISETILVACGNNKKVYEEKYVMEGKNES